MAAVKEDIEAVKEWLSSEVKLDRYADKLVSNGFTSLKSCCTLNDDALDKMNIVMPYHRKRFLMYAEKLREKLGLGLTNGEDRITQSSGLTSHGPEAGNEEQGPFVSADSEAPSDRSSLPTDIISEDANAPMLPPKQRDSVKLPPPIPPRADLFEEVEASDQRSRGEDILTQDSKQVSLPEKSSVQQQQCHQQGQQIQQPEIPTKKILPPVKPPRRTAPKKQSHENAAEDISKNDVHTSVEEQNAISGSHANNSVTVNPSEEDDAFIQFNSTSAIPQLPKPEETMNEVTSGVEVNKEKVLPPIDPKRPAPKAPERTPASRPKPKPRTRVVSEDNKSLADLSSKNTTENVPKGDIFDYPNNTIEKRTKSFSTPGNRRIDSSHKETPSTMPRSVTTKRPVPPLPPSRQSGSVIGRPPTVPAKGENEHQQQQGVPQGICRPVIDHPGPTEGHTSVECAPHEGSEVEASLYELVWSAGQRNPDAGEPDYESDDSLDGLVDDLPEQQGKERGDSIDSIDESRMSKHILSPRVRKSEGYLWKQGGQKNNKGWKKRWFVFDGTDLRYFKDKASTHESLHVIPVSQIKDIEIVKDEKRATFKVITPNRTFILASQNITEMNLWSQTLMEAILSFKGDNKIWKSGGEMCDPDKEGWLKKQGHNVVADWKRRYVAVKDDKICYYDTYEDFIYATPINCISAKLAKVQKVEGHKNRFVIITFNKTYSFQGDSEFDASSWIIAIETAIQLGLGDRAILDKIWENPCNRICADCGMKDPVWASVNFCVCVCAKCIGIHRNLGVHCSRARSLLMDEKIWNPTLVELMIRIGNDKANLLLEHKLPEDDKITPESDVSARREFIYSKYWEKKYCKYHQAFGDADVLGKFLRETVVTDDILTTMELILNKVDVRYVPSDAEDEKTPLELAEEAGQSLQAEVLRQNGGEGSKLDQNSSDDLSSSTSSEASQSIPIEVVYEKEGFLYKKEGNWRKRWFLLKDRQLKYARGPHEKDDLVTIDLRTVTSLVKCTKGELLQLDIVTVEKTHNLKADTEEELEGWYTALRSKQVFGVWLNQQECGSDGIPHLVAKCLQFVETYGGLEMEGVYRVNGGQLTMKKLKTSFDQDARSVLLTLDECGVHDVTGVLKQYLRQLPDPVIPGTMYKQFISAGTIADHNTKLQTIKALINQLPKVNHDTLKAIMFHLTKVVELVAVNKMGVPNIAMIFGPTLMSNENTGRMDDASINQEFSIVGDMIIYYQWLFDVGDEEVEKDRKIKDASQKIRELIELKEKSQNSGGEFTLDIYVKEKDDNPCRPKVSSEMTAGRLCAEIVAQKNLSCDTDWVLFEVIDDGAMERAFQVREKVMSAANWGTGNYLIVKENYIAEQIAPYVGSSLSIEGTLHIRDPRSKSWKQSNVCLKNGYLSVNKERGSIFKAIKSDKSDSEQWPLHKLTLYVGVPAEKATKGVDTSCGFTVVVKTDQEDIIRYMCVKDKSDRNRWLASILNMKHPEGIWSDPSQREALYSVVDPRHPEGIWSDPSQREALYSMVDPRDTRTEDSPLFLGRQSVHLRRKGSSKHVVEELRVRQKSLKRPVNRHPST